MIMGAIGGVGVGGMGDRVGEGVGDWLALDSLMSSLWSLTPTPTATAITMSNASATSSASNMRHEQRQGPRPPPLLALYVGL